MKPSHLLASILLLALTGCGSDKKPEPELSGRLHGGKVQGVEWRTPTRSGSTDADGRFAYLAGETVTFSVGDVELGAVPGAPDITLFTLAGLTPPTGERALRRELDRAMRMSTPLTRAINIDLLLLALDADGNPDNGIDVRNRAPALKGLSLDFDERISEFGYSLYSRVPSLNQSIPLFKPMAHLYSSLGLRVSVHAQKRLLTEATGRASVGVQTFSYAPNGALLADDNDFDGDGTVNYHTGYEYDTYGRVTHTDWSQDYDADQITDQRYTAAYQFDGHGKIVGAEQEQEASRFGPRLTWTLVEVATDELGRATRQVQDVRVDGVLTQRQVTTAEYDASRTRSVFTSVVDDGLDGIADSTSRTTELYDSRHRVLSSISEYDIDADGVIDSRDTYVSTYDDLARTARTVSESDFDADGTADWRGVATSKLDRERNVVAETTSFEPFADGVIWQAESVAREFDSARRVTRLTRDQDANGDGAADSRQTNATTYDELGNVTWATSDYDADVDGHVDAHADEGSEYGPDGEALASASHLDLDGDGLTDSRTAVTVENEIVDDGVRLLTAWFFRTRFSGFQ